MATLAPAAPPALRWPSIDARVATPLVLLLAAVALRWPQFGDPAYDLDEQWYLVVGDRLLHGALPYVDWWDRKPVGLFLLFAGLRACGGGVLPYQLAAALAAAATAWTIARIAAGSSDRFGAAAAALAYLAWIETVGGGGGQAPVFYNLPVALAAEQVLRALATAERKAVIRAGTRAMLLIGLAIQLKYTVVMEGLFFGLVLAGRGMAVMTPRRWLRWLATLVALALAPTLAALAGYALLGHLRAFWFANFVSIFARGPDPAGAAAHRLLQIGGQFLPFAACWVASRVALRRAPAGARQVQAFAWGWLAAALAGFASVGAFYFHYALPLFVPAAVAAAPALAAHPVGRALAGVLLWLPLAHLDWPDRTGTGGHQAALARLAALVPADARTRCLQLFDGPPILFLATGACPASRFAFPDHLVAAKEAGAIGTPRGAEIDRLFARRPGAIVMAAAPYLPDPASVARIRALLHAGYRLAGAAMLDKRRIEVFVPR